MKPRFRIIWSKWAYNFYYGIYPLNEAAKNIGEYKMYIDGVIRKDKSGFIYSIMEEQWV